MQTTGANVPAASNQGMPQIDWLNIASGALSLVNQQRIADLNISRAKQGLPPLSIEQIPGANPTVQVGVEKSTRDILVYGGIGVLAIFGLRSFMKRRR